MAETVAQLQIRLTNVRAAIDRALNVQSYSISGRQITHANLESLMKLEKELQRKLARLNNGPVILSDFSHMHEPLDGGA